MDQAKTLASKLHGYKVKSLPWRLILNNATSTRPKKCGGPTCGPIRDLLHCPLISEVKKDTSPLFEPMPSRPTWSDDFTKHLQECPDEWTCAILTMPNSFKMGDQYGLKVAAAAESKTLAMQKVCLLAFTHLLLRDSNSVLLRANHWTEPVTTIQQQATSISGVQPPASGSDTNLAPAPPPCSRNAEWYYEAPLPDQTLQRNIDICEILTQMIHQSASGWVDPSFTKNWQLLRRFVKPGDLKAFIQQNQQFEIWDHANKKWSFGFARSEMSDQNADGNAASIADTLTPLQNTENVH
jgi:hypothetical protein